MAVDVDIAIVGGGPIGNTLAIALEKLSRSAPLSVAVLEEKAPELTQKTKFYDKRAIVLSLGSTQIFRKSHLWPQLLPHSTPLKTVHVSTRGGFGFTKFHAEQMGVPALGYVVEMSALMSTLVAANLQTKHCQRIAPAKVTAIERQQDGWRVYYEQHGKTQQLQTKMLFAADGVNSTVRRLLSNELNIKTQIKDYHEQAIVANITLAGEHDYVAYERFTREGTVAMLPRAGKQVTAVWTVATATAKHILQQDPQDLLKSLQTIFGYRLGRFLRIGTPVSFPLRQVIMPKQVFPGLVFVGNAAHSIHPIAAQGFNLGLHDIMVLVDCLLEAQQKNLSINDFSILEQYMAKRQWNQKLITTFTHSLTQIFTTKMPGMSLLSNSAMALLNQTSPFKTLLARAAMGLSS